MLKKFAERHSLNKANLLLALSFLFFAALATCVIFWLPPITRYSFGISIPGQDVVISPRTANQPSTNLRLELTSRQMLDSRRETPAKTGIHLLNNSLGERQFEAGIRDSQGRLRWVDFQCDGFPILLRDRFAVATKDNQLVSIDLQDDTQPKQFVDLKGDAFALEPIVGSDGQFLVQQRVANLMLDWTLFSVGSGGLDAKASWPAANPTTQVGSELWELDLPGKAVNIRTLPAGTVTERLSVPPEFYRAASVSGVECFAQGPFFVVSNSAASTQEIFKLPNFAKMNLPSSDLFPARLGSDTDIKVFFDVAAVDEGLLLGWDTKNNKLRWEHCVHNEPTLYEKIESNLAIGYPGMGYTIDIIDGVTGRVVDQIQPYRFAVWLLPLLLIGWFTWLVVYCRRGNKRPILQVLVGSGTSLAALILYMAYWRLIPGYPQVPLFNYCHGLFLGFAIAAYTWLVFGKTRLSLRYLPLLAVLSLQLFICGFVFSNDYRFAAEAFISTMVPASVVAIPMLLVRWAGFRFENLSRGFLESKDAAKNERRFPIRDLFIASLGFAIFLACLKPALNWLDLPTIDPLIIFGSASVICGGIAILLSAQSKAAYVRWSCLLLVLFLYLSLVGEALLEFTLGHYWYFPERMSMIPLVYRVIATAFTTQYLIQSAFAGAGWHLCRQQSSVLGSQNV